MKNVTIYTDGGVCLANPVNANSLAPCGATARMAGTRRLNVETALGPDFTKPHHGQVFRSSHALMPSEKSRIATA